MKYPETPNELSHYTEEKPKLPEPRVRAFDELHLLSFWLRAFLSVEEVFQVF
jgi:hypothetical protein